PFSTSPACRKVNGSCRDLVSFPDRALLLSRLSASFIGRHFIPETSARVIRPCWCAVTTFCPLGQLRFAQARNLPELLHSTYRGFSSRLAARFLSRLWHVRPCQKNR